MNTNLPKRWAIKIDSCNLQQFRNWLFERDPNISLYYSDNELMGHYFHYPNTDTFEGFNKGNHRYSYIKKINDYVEITIEQLLENQDIVELTTF